MLQSYFRQLGLFACAVGVIGLSAFASQHVWRENGLRSLQAANEPRLQLIAHAIYAEIGRQDHLPVVLSLDSDVQAALAAADDPSRRSLLVDRLNRKLERLSREANTRAMFVISPHGIVIASDDWQTPDTLVGANLADRPYFIQAVAAATGESSFLGIEPSTNRVRYYLAQAIRDTALLGVAVVRIEFDTLEAAWERAGEVVGMAWKRQFGQAKHIGIVARLGGAGRDDIDCMSPGAQGFAQGHDGGDHSVGHREIAF